MRITVLLFLPLLIAVVACKPEKDQELDLRYTKDVTWNPPLPEGIFEQQPQPGLLVTPVRCE